MVAKFFLSMKFVEKGARLNCMKLVCRQLKFTEMALIYLDIVIEDQFELSNKEVIDMGG